VKERMAPSARRRLMPDRAALLRVGVGAVQACAIPAAGVNLNSQA
jgi:hypothetical protein